MTAAWDDLTAEFLTRPGVTMSPAFGRLSLMIDGKLFASEGPGGLLIKAPATRVAELVDSGLADPFSSGGGRVMREWAVAHPGTDWPALAAESLAYVRP